MSDENVESRIAKKNCTLRHADNLIAAAAPRCAAKIRSPLSNVQAPCYRVPAARPDHASTEEIDMTFAESIRVCFSKYADFNGCASLSEFWWWVLFTFLAGSALGVVSDRASAVFSIATFLPSIAVGARRLHDTDRSGWFQLLWLIPLVGWIILIVFLVQDSKVPNRYCSDANEVSI